MFQTYITLLHTLRELEKDALSLSLLKKMQTVKFVGVIYILKEVLLSLSALSKSFQAGALNFSHVGPSIEHTQASLKEIKSKQIPLKKLEEDIKHDGRLGSLVLVLSNIDKQILGNLLSAYVSELKKNITCRFSDCLPVLASFSIFSPVALPKPSSPELKEDGKKEITTLANHFFQKEEPGEKEFRKAQLEAEWEKLKFDLYSWKHVLPPLVNERSHESKKKHNASHK